MTDNQKKLEDIYKFLKQAEENLACEEMFRRSLARRFSEDFQPSKFQVKIEEMIGAALIEEISDVVEITPAPIPENCPKCGGVPEYAPFSVVSNYFIKHNPGCQNDD
jgi:hypothetical protein